MPVSALLQAAAASVPSPLVTHRWWFAGLLALVAVLASVAAVLALVTGRDRQAVLARLTQQNGEGRARRRRRVAVDQVLRPDGATTAWGRVIDWLDRFVPESLTPPETAQRLVRAGFDDASAVVLFGALRVVAPASLAFLVPTLAEGVLDPMTGMAFGIGVGVVLPMALLDRLVGRRQQALLRAIPDALDLLVVCLEAGVSLDAAMLRVSRELEVGHPAMAAEMTGVTRRVAAGLPREEALRGLHVRSGLDELRSLAAVMVQAERWGTALARVLRVHAEGVRTERRQKAEKAAQEASVKMIFPIVLFLLPAFFTVVLGPAILSIRTTLK